MLERFGHLIVYAQAGGSVVLLVGFLIATTILQRRAVAQSTDVLEGAAASVKATQLFKSANDYFERRKLPLTKPAHMVSVWVLILIVFLCSLATYFSAGWFDADSTPSYVLGGALAAGPATPELARYQSATVFTGSMAFLSAYIWMIGQLVNRMNNNDMSPITFHFLSVRILTACLVAGVARHIFEAIPVLRELIYNSDKAPVGLALVGFVIGWKPSFWIDELYDKAREFLRSKGLDQRPPDRANLPQDMSLQMIQGMVDGKIDRLKELDIDNCQRLARENAIILWLRTPYNLEMIVDWVAQAQLCVLLEDDKVEALRKVGVRDIFGYLEAIAPPASRTAIQLILQTVPIEVLAGHLEYISKEPAFTRLQELRKAITAA
jgi:hypothetical protein